MYEELKELWRFRELLLTMVQRDLKIRYKNSLVGFLLSLLNPLVSVAVMAFVVTNFLNRGVPSGSAYIFAAYIPFIFFQFCLLDSAQSILTAMPLIKKIYFPREILPIAAVLTNFIHFVLMIGIFFLFLIGVYLVHPGDFPIQASSLMLPLLLLASFMLSMGLALIVSALNTFYEDVKYIVSLGLYLLYFLCPIMYFSEQVTNSPINHSSNGLVHKLYHLNPIAMLCTAYKHALVAPSNSHPTTWFDARFLAAAVINSFLVLLFGYWLFNQLKWKFVERP